MAGEYPDRPVAAVSMLLERQGRVLLVRRRLPPAAGLWALPGGKVELGETVAEAAVREVREECGVEARVREVLTVVDILDREPGRIRYHYVLVVCRGVYLAGEPAPSAEAADARWVAPAEAAELSLTEKVWEVIRRYAGESRAAWRPDPRGR